MAARPMEMMPFCVTSRSERWAKRLGTHWSTAMAASVAGPARKPVCAATNRSAPSLASVNTTIQIPTGNPPSVQPRVSSDDPDAVLRHQPLREVGEALGDPLVDRHGRERRGAGEEAGLRGHEQERALARGHGG